MKLRTPLLLGAAATALVVGVAGPASAADTATTFMLTGGDLSVAPAASAALGSAATGAASTSGSLGANSVTDARGGTVSAASAGFTGPGSTHSTGVSYTSGAVTNTGTVTVVGSSPASIASAATVVAGTAVSGNNTASWTPSLTVALPADALAGAYTGTVTTSVA